jgi:hypothetical protein
MRHAQGQGAILDHAIEEVGEYREVQIEEIAESCLAVSFSDPADVSFVILRQRSEVLSYWERLSLYRILLVHARLPVGIAR